MKFKNLFSAIGFTAVSLFATAQTQIANPSFELWNNPTQNTAEPQQWTSNKGSGGGNASSSFAPQTCWRESTDPHTGTYCARVKTGTAALVGTVVNGALVTGRVEAPTTVKAEGYISSIPGASTGPAMAFTGRPDSLVFWIKYSPVVQSGKNEYATVQARLHTNANCYTPETPVNGNHPAIGAGVIVGRAVYQSANNVAINSWTRVSVPFVYDNTSTPAYILISTTSSGDQANGVENSTLWLDDFEAIYNIDVTIAPTAQQNLAPGANGTLLTVTETPAASSREWKWTTTSGTGYQSFSTAQTGTTYTPNFSSPGTYYVVCQSVINSSTITSNEVVVNVTNNTLTTGTVSGSPFYNSASANLQVSVPFTSNVATFNSGNQFIAELSNEFGSFTSGAQEIGTLSSTAVAPVTATLPGNLSPSSQYKIRVKSTNPLIVGSESNAFEVIPFSVSVAPTTQQSIEEGQDGTAITATETHTTGVTREWKWRTTGTYSSWSPAKTDATYTPNFGAANTYYVKVVSTNSFSDAVESQEITIVVSQISGINDAKLTNIKIYQSANDLMLVTDNNFVTPENFTLYAITGQEVLHTTIKSGVNKLNIQNLTEGVYIFRLGKNTGRVVIK